MIEMLIVLVVAAILAAIAWPAYQNQVFRGRRSDAMSALAIVSQAQERWRSDNPAYQAVMTELTGGLTESPDHHYVVTMVEGTVTASAYTVQATVKSGSPQANDSTCQAMRMRLDAGQINYTSSSSSGANGLPDPCWVR